MRTLFLALITFIAFSCLAEYNFSTTVGSSSTTISPASGTTPRVASTGDSVALGDVVDFDGLAYLALEAGTVTIAPTGQVETVTTPKLRLCRLERGRLALRKLVIFEAVTGDIWWTVGAGDAAVGKGIRLNEGERMWLGAPGALKAISTSGAVIVTQELFQ